ncbi:jg19243 [Pararge aegeria aegeria]|uniref:Jg19243 protein n=1 Tax=Pararge aegeria aegeria TaxID=348720 RepID=A0A8S4R642_9NEOP|nr:jg19243 [Pararge aegeria aegeria]
MKENRRQEAQICASYAAPVDTIVFVRRARRGVKVACDPDPLTPQLGRRRLRWVLVGILADVLPATCLIGRGTAKPNNPQQIVLAPENKVSQEKEEKKEVSSSENALKICAKRRAFFS